MKDVRNRAEVEGRIGEIEARLKILNDAIDAEVKRPYFDRRQSVCAFLDLEKRTTSACLEQLKWMIYE